MEFLSEVPIISSNIPPSVLRLCERSKWGVSREDHGTIRILAMLQFPFTDSDDRSPVNSGSDDFFAQSPVRGRKIRDGLDEGVFPLQFPQEESLIGFISDDVHGTEQRVSPGYDE